MFDKGSRFQEWHPDAFHQVYRARRAKVLVQPNLAATVLLTDLAQRVAIGPSTGNVVCGASRKRRMRIAGLILAVLLPMIAGCKILPQEAVQPPPTAVGQDGGVVANQPDGTVASTAASLRPKTRPAALEPIAATEGDAAPLRADGVAPVPLKSKDQITCEKRRGTWTNAGKSNIKTCIQRTRDAGKQCRKQGDCSSACLARSGTCAPVKPLFGCNEILQKDGSRATLCID